MPGRPRFTLSLRQKQCWRYRSRERIAVGRGLPEEEFWQAVIRRVKEKGANRTASGDPTE